MSQVRACSWVRRVGLYWLGFLVSSFLLSPSTLGVFFLAVNFVPSVFAAWGYVPK
jgi:hypothetical protein